MQTLSPDQPVDDRDLASAAGKGDERAFETLVERYRGFIYSTAWKILLNEDDALDVTQMVLIRMSTHLGSWRGEGTLASWIRTMTVRTALNRRRAPGWRETATECETIEHAAAMRQTSEPLLDRIESRQRLALVTQAMEQLPAQQRAVLMLRLYEEIGPSEIARRLDLPPGQVRTQLFRAMARMKEIFAGER